MKETTTFARVQKERRLNYFDPLRAPGIYRHLYNLPGIFPDDQAGAQAKPVTAGNIDTVEKMGDALNLKLLTTPPEELLEIKRFNDYKFNFTDMFGDRGDIINKDMPR